MLSISYAEFEWRVPDNSDATYFGGQGRDSARGVALDSSRNAYITGFSTSTDFPTTTGAYQTKPAGQEDAFVVKVNAAGSGLVYSTLIGGAGSDIATGIAVDQGGNAHIAGYTNSLAFPVTSRAFQRCFGGGSDDAFVAEVSASGSQLLYSTYLGGSGTDLANGIAVDSLGFTYVAGFTDSANFPIQNALQATAGGQGDAFVAKLNPAGDSLSYATYLGGRSTDNAKAVAVDVNGYACIAGSTSSSDFPVTAGAFQTSSGGGYDAFVTKLSAAGTAIVFSTYVGGEAADEAESIAVDGSGAAYIAGFTDSLRFPVKSAVNSSPKGGQDAFAAAVAPDGSSLSWSTYLGGASADEATGTAVDPTGGVYIAGYTLSSDFQMTAGAYRTAYAGGDGFVVKLQNLPLLSTISPASGVQGSSVAVTLTGTNFVPGAAVRVANAEVAVSDVSVVSGTQITATFAIADNTALGAANVTVTTAAGTSGAVGFAVSAPPPTITVRPGSVSLGAGQTQQFTAVVTNEVDTTVKWSISPQVGTISSGGVYTAPSSIASQRTVAVSAVSNALPTLSASATVTLSAVPATLYLTNQTIAAGTVTYAAINDITAGSAGAPFTINGTATVTFIAGRQIRLEPTFHSTAGSAGITFHATINPTF